MKDDKLYLVHMLECISRIEAYTRDGQEAFMASSMTQDAVIRNFEIIGEAAKRVGETLKGGYPDIPWRRVAGLRDVLIHDYTGIDLDEVWNIICDEVPDLKRKIERILQG